ncbi:triacylglycerol lipase [Mycobacterium sp. DSM 3803]|nr:triacylglycerol lipase [Mycobacterium sp. DSM 3803]
MALTAVGATSQSGGSGSVRRFFLRGARNSAAVVLAVLVAAATALTAAPAAFADDRIYEEWYTPPEPLPPGAPGDLIRTEPSRLVFEPSGQLSANYRGTGTRIMYRSTDAQGKPVAVTGTYIEPDAPWTGNGPRPLLAYATGPYGVGEQCAPSRLVNQGIHFSQGFDLMLNVDQGFFGTLVARGFAIVITDGVGMGVHGPQSPQFLNRVAAGTAMIDAARAAMKLPGTSLDPHGPVGFFGWASGGQAALSAAELAPTYGPELNVVGAAADAPITDVAEALPGIDGSFLAVLTGYALRGVFASVPETADTIRSVMTPRGLQMLDWSGHTCLVQGAVDYAFRHIQYWFNTDIGELFGNDPFKSLLAAQRLGNLKPEAPVYITQNRWDPLVSYNASMLTAQDWCSKGADVTVNTNEEPPLFNKLDINLLLPLFVDGERTMAWLADRFNGVPTSSNCGQFGPNV